MPLLNGVVFTVDRTLSPELKSEAEVWHYRPTGETFVNYQELLDRQNLCRSRDFSSGYTGKSGLNFEEAQREDEHAKQALQKFPMELEESALRIVHNTYATVSELVERIYVAHRPGKENAQDASPQSTKQKHPMPRPLIRNWLFEVGSDMKQEGRHLYRAKPEYVEKYNLNAPQAGSQAPATAPAERSQPGRSDSDDIPIASLAQLENGHDATAQPVAKPAAAHVSLPPPKSLEEEEVRLKESKPEKRAAFKVLQGAGPQGMRVTDLIAALKAQPDFADWDSNKTRYLRNALAQDHAFVRVATGVFALRAIAGNIDFLEPSAKPTTDELQDSADATKKRKADSQSHPVSARQQSTPAATETLNVEATNAPHAAAPHFKKLAHEANGQPLQVPKSPKPRAPKAPAVDPAAMQDPSSRFRTLTQTMAANGSDEAQANAISLETAQLLSLYRQAVQQAQEVLEKARAKLKEKPAPKKQPSPKAAALGAGEVMPSFEMSDDEKLYRGDPEDRKALMAHRKLILDKERLLAKQKAAWLAARQGSAPKASSKSPSSVAVKAINKATEVLSVVSLHAAKAEGGAAEVLSTLTKLLNAEKVADQKAAKEKARQEEKERKAREAAEAKRYPMEDLELLAEQQAKAAAEGLPPPPEDVPLPEMMGSEESEAVATTLYASDFMSQFADVLGIKRPLSFLQLHDMLNARSSSSADNDDRQRVQLWASFRSLLAFILQADKADAHVRKLRGVLNVGTWPEVMLRYVLHSNSTSAKLRTDRTSVAAGMLEREPADTLAAGHLRALLAFLCDEALDAEGMRDALSSRLESQDEARANMRKANAEEKRKLNEVLAQEKEERRQKREAEILKKHEEAVAAAGGEDRAAAAQEGQSSAEPAAPAEAADGSTPAPESAPGTKKFAGKLAAAPEDDEDEAEPTWDLPGEMQEWKGDPTDRKGMLLFRQQQQTARQVLEKQKAQWHREAAEREKVRESARKAQVNKEKARAKEKQSAEQALMRQRQAYEEEVSALSTRANPLGMDRRGRRYWWGLGGQRGCLFVEDFDARLIGAWTSLAEVDALVESLDKRGVREAALLVELNKARDALMLAMKPSTPERTTPADPDAGTPEKGGRRYGQRERAQVVLYSPGRVGDGPRRPESASPASKKQKKDREREEQEEEEQQAMGLEGAAAQAVLTVLHSLQRDAVKAGLDAPIDGAESTTWRAFADIAQTASDMIMQADEAEDMAVDGAASPRKGDSTISARSQARLMLVQQLLHMENTLFAASAAQGSPEVSDEDDKVEKEEDANDEEGDESSEEGSQDEEEDSADGGAKRGQRVHLWPSEQDRSAWLQDAGQAATVARIAFCAAMLEGRANRLLQRLIDEREQQLAQEAEQAAARAKEAAAEAKKAATAKAKSKAEAKKQELAEAKKASAAEAKTAAAAEARSAAEAKQAAATKAAAAKAKQGTAAPANKSASAADKKAAGAAARKAAPPEGDKANSIKRKGKEKEVTAIAKRTRSAR